MIIDTHIHLDGEEFADDIDDVVARAKQAGVSRMLLPAIDYNTTEAVAAVAQRFDGYALPMIGLHPEEVKADWREVLARLRPKVGKPFVAIGEVGLDFYWSREFESQQLEAFEEQVKWSVETRLPLMIHCRKAQNEMVGIMKKYKAELPGGVFHCFTGNEKEAEQLLDFPNFVLGIGGVLTFKKSNLPTVLATSVPIDRIVLETDAPYMAPVPMRGKRNESGYLVHVVAKMAEAYGVAAEDIERITTATAERVFSLR
ncbi:MAG: TatD family hydrolase [Prevotellaceae bacterium]|nr:TatD family hydrolase [Prevotellaceae bacterium]